MKKFTAILLVLSLLFAFALFASAQEIENNAEESNPAMPVITLQPQGGRSRGSHHVSIEASAPNGDEISFRWYRNGILAFQGIWEDSAHVGTPGATTYYHIVVYNRTNPAYYVKSDVISVEVYTTFMDSVADFLGEFFDGVSRVVTIAGIVVLSPIWIPLAGLFVLALPGSPLWAVLLGPIVLPVMIFSWLFG